MILDFEMFELDDLETCFSEVQHLFRIMLKKCFSDDFGMPPSKNISTHLFLQEQVLLFYSSNPKGRLDYSPFCRAQHQGAVCFFMKPLAHLTS